MKHFPIFISVEGRRIIVSGGQEAALAKLRLLLKTTASITVYAQNVHKDIILLAEAESIPLSCEEGNHISSNLHCLQTDGVKPLNACVFNLVRLQNFRCLLLNRA